MKSPASLRSDRVATFPGLGGRFHRNTQFALAVINSAYGQAYFRSKAKRTTNLASINSKEVARFPLPLPPLGKQRSLVNELLHGRQKAAELHQKAIEAHEAAWTDFEASVYAVENKAEAADLDTSTPTQPSTSENSTAQ